MLRTLLSSSFLFNYLFSVALYSFYDICIKFCFFLHFWLLLRLLNKKHFLSMINLGTITDCLSSGFWCKGWHLLWFLNAASKMMLELNILLRNIFLIYLLLNPQVIIDAYKIIESSTIWWFLWLFYYFTTFRIFLCLYLFNDAFLWLHESFFLNLKYFFRLKVAEHCQPCDNCNFQKGKSL